MPCHAAIVEKVPHLTPDQTIEEAMKIFKKSKLDCLPVVEGGKTLSGFLSLHIVLKNLLPVSVTIEGPMQGQEFIVGAAPGVSKRLKKVVLLSVDNLQDRKFTAIKPDTPLWEGIRHIVQNGGPLPVIDPETEKFLGIVNEQSLLTALEKSTKE